ncbi:hypothetical protein [Pedobacter sp. B4-66]|uniref:hypothetical protein n=1 Tax=Pedobacter sp. B4-66 TaxID=2817280 RepID=UPI001BD9C745|nr:hypothetical protein [Pedobacter sp. B4-66]
MLKNISLIFLINLLIVGNCKSQSSTIDTNDKNANTIKIITDNLFRDGINLLGISSSDPRPIEVLYPFGKTNLQPIWKMPQWGSIFNLQGVKPEIKDDSVIYKNEGKKVSFLLKNGEAIVNMEVYASKEYLTPRKEGESWPHLLLEQKTNSIKLVNLKKLTYNIDAKLNYAVNKMGEDYNPGLHTCQITVYLLVQNNNNQSTGRGDYFWFGLPLYDYRYRNLEEYGAQDLGKEDATKKYILNVASETLFSGSLHDKQWISINKDIYPQLLAAFNQAKEKGYLKTSSISDMSIESTNLGWEVPGTFDCSIQLKGLKLIGTTK